MRTALVIGKTNPFYGQIVQVGVITLEGVYPITPVDASEHGWHTGYAREDQLQFQDNPEKHAYAEKHYQEHIEESQ